MLQRIETLMGSKLLPFTDMEDKDALMLNDSVVEATRIANMELRESEKGKAIPDDDVDN